MVKGYQRFNFLGGGTRCKKNFGERMAPGRYPWGLLVGSSLGSFNFDILCTTGPNSEPCVLVCGEWIPPGRHPRGLVIERFMSSLKF